MTPGTPFVGRDAEQSQLLRQIRSAVAGRGGLTMLGGEAGVGKSALLQVVLESQAAEVPVCVVGRCPGPQETPPYGPWVEVVHRLRQQLGWETDSLPCPFGKAPTQNAYELAGVLAHWFGHRGCPLVLVLEDLHWADAASLDVLRHMAPHLPHWPVRVIGTYRTDEVCREHVLWQLLPELQRSGADRIILERLTRREVRELAAKFAAREGFPRHEGCSDLERFTEWVYDRTAGLTLFVCELLHLLMRTGEMPNPGDPLPQSLQQAIDSKLNRLPPGTREVLEPAAVVGERFSFNLLLRVVDLPADELSSALEAAVSRHVIRPEGIDGDEFAFQHALYREAILLGLAGSRRRSYHQRIAAALEGDPDVDADTIAYHLMKARDPRAPAYLTAAGDRARRLGAVVQAAERYKQSLAHVPPGDPQRCEMLLMLGWCLRERDPESAVTALTAAKEAAHASNRPAAALWAQHLLLLLGAAGNRARLFDQLNALMADQEGMLGDPAYQRLEAELFGGPAGFPRISSFLARALALSGEPERARHLMQAIAPRALPGAAADVAAARMVLDLLAGRLDAAADQCSKVAAWAHRLRHYPQAIFFRTNEIMIRLVGPADQPEQLDHLAEQLHQLEQEAWQQAGYAPMKRGFSLTGVYRYFRGDWASGYCHVVEAARQDPRAYGGTLNWYAAAMLLNTGDPPAALPFAEKVPPLLPDDPFVTDNSLMILPHVVKAQIYTALGDLPRARAWLEAARRWPALNTAPFYRANFYLAWAAYHRKTGNMEAAWEAARQALHDAAAAASRLAALQAHRLLGELAAAGGEVDAAAQHFESSLQLAARCRFPFEAALTRLARGRCLGDRSNRLADLRAAYATFAEAGVEPAVALVRQALLEAGMGPVHTGMEHDKEPLPPWKRLTGRQLEVIALVCQGLTDREIAQQLFISPKTVDRHLQNIFTKLGVRNRAALVAYAVQHGLLAGNPDGKRTGGSFTREPAPPPLDH